VLAKSFNFQVNRRAADLPLHVRREGPKHGVSRVMQRFEQQLGVRLLDRTPKAVTLTNEGKQFYQEVAPLLAGLEAAAIDAGQSATTVRGRLRVNVDPTFARLILAHIESVLLYYSPQTGLLFRRKDAEKAVELDNRRTVRASRRQAIKEPKRRSEDRAGFWLTIPTGAFASDCLLLALES
jgi:hypothetical protein